MASLEQVTSESTRVARDGRFRLFLLFYATVLAMSSIALWSVGLLSGRVYFVISFIWLLIAGEVFAPLDSRATWWTRLQLVKIAGWVGLVYLIAERVVIVVVL